jgi:hypothetical protein
MGTAVLLSGLSVAVLAMMVHDPGGSSRTLARELARQRLPGQPVLAIDSYPFDLAFYAGLREPVVVLGAWSDPRLRQSDNWRKELADAGDFAPVLRERTLVSTESLAARVCAAPLTWVVASRDAPAQYPALAAARQVAVSRDLVLWAASRDRLAGLACREMPNVGSP